MFGLGIHTDISFTGFGQPYKLQLFYMKRPIGRQLIATLGPDGTMFVWKENSWEKV